MSEWTKCFYQLPPEGVVVEIQTNAGSRRGVRMGDTIIMHAFAEAPESRIPARSPNDSPTFTVRWRSANN